MEYCNDTGMEADMLEKEILGSNIDKAEIKAVIKPEIKMLGERLSILQQQLKEAKIPVIILFEGWGAAGKGDLIGKMILNLDPRGFQVYITDKPTKEEKRKPFLNRFWKNIPLQGQITIFDKSWYYDYTLGQTNEINIFERQLTDNGYMIIKFFLHISKNEQTRRLKKLKGDRNSEWRVTKEDIKENHHFEDVQKKYEVMLQNTDEGCTKWNIVSGMDKHIALRNVLKIVVAQLEISLQKKNLKQIGILPGKMNFKLLHMPKLSEIDLSCTIAEKDYKNRLDFLQRKLHDLSYTIYQKKIPLIICYEGWDAAGKGGNIKRVVAGLDPRYYDVTPVAAPDIYEAGRHYLWRFQKDMPKSGEIQIFDRTWYGRVMVERVEGFCTKKDWKRAYNEINEFENGLTEWGAIIVKFWLQVDKEEQLLRFQERQNNPDKNWKITDEDWRNREKWDQYEEAVNDMLQYTSTAFAPWTIVESNCKHYARIKALETIIDAIEKKLR